jgi:hypothetical protein
MNELIPLAMLALVWGMFALLASVAQEMARMRAEDMKRKSSQAKVDEPSPDSNGVS